MKISIFTPILLPGFITFTSRKHGEKTRQWFGFDQKNECK